MSAFMNLVARAAEETATVDTNRTFKIDGYQVVGNTVLPPSAFNVLSNYTGPKLTLPKVREGLGELQLVYQQAGFPTVAVTLPQQKVTNGIVRVQVVEGHLSRVTVSGNNWFSVPNVLRAVPGLTTNSLLNTHWLQPELDRANANLDRQIYPEIGPGPDPGTTELVLKVKDRLPLHGHVEVNDKSTPGTPLLRVDSAIQYNNLWQREHQIGLEYNFSPQATKSDGTPYSAFYDAPSVVSYSGFYRIPFSFGGDMRQEYEQSPATFGYNQVTHRFDLPAPMGTPELDFFVSRSTTDTGLQVGQRSSLTSSATLDIQQQTVSRAPSDNADVGAKFSLPLRSILGVQSSLSLGSDYKSYALDSQSTHYAYVQMFSTNPPTVLGSATNIVRARTVNTLFYFPLSAGWSGARPDRQGSFNFFVNQNLFLPALLSGQSDFQKAAGSRSAGKLGSTVTAGLVREELLPRDWSAVFNANGQWSSEPLIANEQFALGGTSGVRGYREGETYGDSGWRTQFDLRAPAINVGYLPAGTGDIPADLRCSWFMDYGEAYYLASKNPAVRQWGTGVGFFLTAGDHLSARLTLAWALLRTQASSAGSAQAYFSLNAQF
jgi:hemolysin activation/secretion protein